MMKQVTLSALFLLSIFCTSSKGQTKTGLPTAVITPHGPKTSVRIIRQDRPPITATLLQMFGRSSKIEKAIPGSVAVMVFGVMTATHFGISQRILSGMSTKIKKETFGPVVLMTRASLSFPVMMKGHCLVKSQG